MMQQTVTFVIMAGGGGERLWPLVRHRMPKVCLSLNGRGSLLQGTVARLRRLWPRASYLIVTTRDQEAGVRAELPPSLQDGVLVEPRIRNTAACLTWAAATVALQDPRRVMVVAPADHWIPRPEPFRDAVEEAVRLSLRDDTIATIGIRPTRAHLGLGYLCCGRAISRWKGGRAFSLIRFVEKPSRARLRRLLERPGTYWNSGVFVATAETFLARLKERLPGHVRWIAPLAEARMRMNRARQAFLKMADQAYRRVPAISFDRGVMSRLSGGVVVEGRFTWVDVGSWEAWASAGGGASRSLHVDASNVTVVTQDDGHLVAAVGVRDLLVVHSPTATLICRPDQAQRVREVVQRIHADPALTPYR